MTTFGVLTVQSVIRELGGTKIVSTAISTEFTTMVNISHMDPWLMVWSGDHGSMVTLQEELRWRLGKKTFKRVFFLGFFYRGDNLRVCCHSQFIVSWNKFVTQCNRLFFCMVLNKGGFWAQGVPSPSPFCPVISFSFVNVCKMVLRALLLKYIFFNKHC